MDLYGWLSVFGKPHDCRYYRILSSDCTDRKVVGYYGSVANSVGRGVPGRRE
jgi:hypothetical protein